MKDERKQHYFLLFRFVTELENAAWGWRRAGLLLRGRGMTWRLRKFNSFFDPILIVYSAEAIAGDPAKRVK